MIKKLTLLFLLLLTSCAQPQILNETDDCIETEIIISESWNVQGILCEPKNASKEVAVLLLSGSGINDADYTIGQTKVYRDLAHNLANSGIASLRMNKRSLQKLNTIQEEIIDDATIALQILKKKYSQVFVLGHSLSGIILPVFSDDVDGLIVVSGSVSELEEVYAKQLMKQTDEKEKQVIQEELETILTLQEDSGFSWFGIQESYWISLDQLDLTQELQTISCPILVLHGSQDEMIDAFELNHYQQVLDSHDDAEFVLFEGLNHYLINEKTRELEESVIQKIVSWILERSSVIIKV